MSSTVDFPKAECPSKPREKRFAQFLYWSAVNPDNNEAILSGIQPMLGGT